MKKLAISTVLLLFLLTTLSNGTSGPISVYHHPDGQFINSEQQLTSPSNHRCPPWSYFDSEKQMCNHDIYYAVQFFDNRTHLRVGYCATYDEALELISLSPCPYFQSDGFTVQKTRNNIWYIELPDNVSKLNDYMCGPLNRKGRVCSECKDGFGPAVTSIGFLIVCSNCTGVWYGIPLYIFLEFVPVTIFYLLILIFEFNITTAPMTCYILFSQLVPLWWNFAFDGEDFNVSRQMFILNKESEIFRKIILTLYDVWNLQFFHLLVPPFCISSSLKPFHVVLLGYISVFYPMFLIVFTWICISLHSNFSSIVWIWRPFRKCFHYLRRKWNTRKTNNEEDYYHIDITNVFVSFFLLSFSKVLYQTDLFWSFQTIRNLDYNNLGKIVEKYWVTNVDLTLKYTSSQHLLFAVPAMLIVCIFNILPSIILLVHPVKGFRDCLSRCSTRFAIFLDYFVEKFNGCYRDHGKDMRSFAALYFIVRPLIFVANSILSVAYISNNDPYLGRSVVFVLTALVIAICRPYKRMYMNVLDALLLAHFGLICHLISSYPGFQYQAPFVITFDVMLLLPFLVFIVFVSLKIFQKARSKFCPGYTCNWPNSSQSISQQFKSCCSSCFRQSSDSDRQQLLSSPTDGATTYGIVSIEDD